MYKRAISIHRKFLALEKRGGGDYLKGTSSSSTRGRGGRSVRSPHGPILCAVEGVSSGQPTVWTNLVQPGDRRTAPWSALVWEGWNSVSDVACHAQKCFGWYIIWHTRNLAEQWETAPANNWLYTLQTRSGVDFGIRYEVGSFDAQNPSLTAQMKGFQSLPVRFRQRPRFAGIHCENAAGV